MTPTPIRRIGHTVDIMPTEKPEMSDQVKMMRFVASQVDKIVMKLDQIYNMQSMILRAVRKE